MLFKKGHLLAAVLLLTGCPAPTPKDAALVWMRDYPSARARAKATGKPLMIDFSATWCEPCHELEREVFNAPAVRTRLAKEVILLKLDFDALGQGDAALLQRFEVSGLPRVAFESSDGVFLRQPSFEGKISPGALLSKLDAL